MVRSRLRLTIYMGAAMLAVGGGAVAAVAATTPATTAAGTLTATFTKDSDWGSGYQARYTIKNTGGSAVTGWQVVFALPASAKLGSTWDAAATTSGSTVTAKDRGYNASIAAGASTEFGFIVAGSGAPTSCTINGAACTGGPATTTPPTTAPTTRPPTTAPTTRPPPPAPPRRHHPAALLRWQRARGPVRRHGSALQLRLAHPRAAGHQRRGQVLHPRLRHRRGLQGQLVRRLRPARPSSSATRSTPCARPAAT